MSTIGDDLLRDSGEPLPDGTRFGPRIEALVVYNSNLVAVAPHSGKVARGFARDDLYTVVPDFVPNHESPSSTPALAARFPLAMISPPPRKFLSSTFVNVESLRGAGSEPVLELSADDAARRGIAAGQRVRVFNDRGSIEGVADVATRARPGVVNGMGVWWKKLSRDGRNVNELTHQGLTDLGRAPTFYDCLVEVEAAPVAA